jgi:hypothetical protein
MVAAKLSQSYSKWLLLKEGGVLEYNNKMFVKNMKDEGTAKKLLLSKIMNNHRKSKDQQLRASSLIEVVDKCYMEASKDVMFSVFCQSVAKCLGVDVLDKSKKKLVKGWIIDLNKANKLVLPAVNNERAVIDGRNRAADRATVSCKGVLVLEADLKIPGNWIWTKPQGVCPPCHIARRGDDVDETKLDDKNDDNDDGGDGYHPTPTPPKANEDEVITIGSSSDEEPSIYASKVRYLVLKGSSIVMSIKLIWGIICHSN